MILSMRDVGILMDLTNGTYLADGIFYNEDKNKHLYTPIPEASYQQLITPRNAILHSNAGPKKTWWERLRAFMARADIHIESHFIPAMDGSCKQLMPVNRKADCNAKANVWWENGQPFGAISFETQDEGYPTLATTPWTIPQMERMIEILTWLCVMYDMDYTAPVGWNDSGIGYHSQFPEWSIYTGKTCPGAQRIKQMDYIRLRVTGNVWKFMELRAA